MRDEEVESELDDIEDRMDSSNLYMKTLVLIAKLLWDIRYELVEFRKQH